MKKESKKIELNKKTIQSLDNREMSKIKGGGTDVVTTQVVRNTGCVCSCRP